MHTSMQSAGEDGVRKKMAELRLICEREISIQQHKIESSFTSYWDLLDSAKSKAQQTVQLQERLRSLKGELREAEDDLVKALSVKTRKEAKRMTLTESISVMKARVENLKGIVENQKAKKDEYTAIIGRQSEAFMVCKEKFNQDSELIEQIEDAISWYNKVLGFRIECGHGVKFIFTNINLKDPNAEYSFIIRHENDVYTLLECNPHVIGTKELVSELNKDNGLFKFVRIMRVKFQEAAACGISSHGVSIDQNSSTISLSAPVASDSTDPSPKSPVKRKGPRSAESIRNARKVDTGLEILSPGSSSSLRRSSRLKGKN